MSMTARYTLETPTPVEDPRALAFRAARRAHFRRVHNEKFLAEWKERQERAAIPETAANCQERIDELEAEIKADSEAVGKFFHAALF